MQCIALHIEINYIAGAICNVKSNRNKEIVLKSDDVQCGYGYPLYFKIDSYNHLVRYKEEYKYQCVQGEEGYVYQIFNNDIRSKNIIINDGRYNILEILNKSGIIRSIKSQYYNYVDNCDINAFISFSKNISLENRLFINEFLERNGIKIISSTIDLSELVCYKDKYESKDIICIEGFSEDITMSIVKRKDDLYEKDEESIEVLKRVGNDPIEESLLDLIIEKLSIQTPFLRTKESREKERIKQLKNIKEWLSELNNKDRLILDTNLCIDPYNKYRLFIDVKDVHDNTSRYVRDIVANLKSYKIRRCQSRLNTILILGGIANNALLCDAISKEYGAHNIYLYSRDTVKDIIKGYPDTYKKIQKEIDRKVLEDEYRVNFAKAEKSKKRKEYDKAITYYEKSLEVVKKEAYKNKYESIKLLNDNINDVKRARKEEKQEIKKYDQLIVDAEKQTDLKDYYKAKQFLLKALSMKPDDISVERKIDEINVKILETDNQIKSLKHDADHYIKEHKLDKAIQRLEEIKKLDPKSKNINKLIEKCEKDKKAEKIKKGADFYFKKEMYLEAKNEYEKCLDDVYCKKMYKNSSSLYKTCCLIDEKIHQIEKCIDGSGYDKINGIISDIYIEIGKAYEDTGVKDCLVGYKEKISQIKKILFKKEDEKREIELKITTANALFENKEWQSAKNMYKEVGVLGVQDDLIVKNRQICYEQIKKTENHIRKADNCLRQGKKDIAFIEYKKALEYSPNISHVIEKINQLEKENKVFNRNDKINNQKINQDGRQIKSDGSHTKDKKINKKSVGDAPSLSAGDDLFHNRDFDKAIMHYELLLKKKEGFIISMNKCRSA